MKKFALFLGVFLIIFSVNSTVYAGSLNSYENEVIAAAQKIYEYNGVQYQVDPQYISQLISYLSSDDVELTAKQRDEVLDTAFASIEQGVTEGYLVPVKGSDNSSQGSNSQGNSSQGNTTQGNTSSGESTQENTTQGNTSPGDTSQGNTSEVDSSQETASQGDLNQEPTSEENTSQGSITQEPQGQDNSSEGNSSANSSGQISQGDASADSDHPVSSGADPEAVITDILKGTDGNIIKNTGFDFNTPVLILAGLGMLMLTAVLITVKSGYFAHDDE